jgi:hypothetical protein
MGTYAIKEEGKNGTVEVLDELAPISRTGRLG